MKKFHKELTAAERVFKKSPILNERPEGMTFEEYKIARRLQTRAIRIVTSKNN